MYYINQIEVTETYLEWDLVEVDDNNNLKHTYTSLNKVRDDDIKVVRLQHLGPFTSEEEARLEYSKAKDG